MPQIIRKHIVAIMERLEKRREAGHIFLPGCLRN